RDRSINQQRERLGSKAKLCNQSLGALKDTARPASSWSANCDGRDHPRRSYSSGPDYRRAARCGGTSQRKRAMVRRSMSAGVLLIHNSLAGLVTLLDLLYGPGARLSTAARLNNGREGRPGALPRRQPRWNEFLLGFMRDHASRRKSFPTTLAVWGDR
ncbi:MAG TPA: hypothetical protein VM715_05840, partial [Candidatus Acidoferrum sp.]|nr:hypothetical protein [Candidatus Acidoferrum sp.]